MMCQSTLTSFIVFSLFCSVVAAQEQPDFPAPTKQHEWLQQFVGEWTTASKGSMGPDQPPMECSGTIKSRMIGGFWVVNEMQGDVQGTPMHGLQAIGYDTTNKKYVGTWIDSMMNHLWQYEGTVDAAGKKLTFEAEGPNFMADGKLTKYRDEYAFTAPNKMKTTSSMLGDDGKWVTFMTGEATRTKGGEKDEKLK